MRLADLYERYREKVEFLAIYIREAHARDGWWFGKGLTKSALGLYSPLAAMDVDDPQSFEERLEVAGRCHETLKYGIETYVDDVDDHVNQAYAAWPTRLYLIGADGRVVYHGGIGPFGFKPSKLGEAIESLNL